MKKVIYKIACIYCNSCDIGMNRNNLRRRLAWHNSPVDHFNRNDNFLTDSSKTMKKTTLFILPKVWLAGCNRYVPKLRLTISIFEWINPGIISTCWFQVLFSCFDFSKSTSFNIVSNPFIIIRKYKRITSNGIYNKLSLRTNVDGICVQLSQRAVRSVEAFAKKQHIYPWWWSQIYSRTHELFRVLGIHIYKCCQWSSEA